MRWGAALILLLPLLAASAADAQQADAMPGGASVGYELMLSGATRGERGHGLTLIGVAYEVEGLAGLRPRAGLEVGVEITARRGSGRGRRTVATAGTRSAQGGRFSVAIDLPTEPLSAPRLELTVGRSGQPQRRFVFGLHTSLDEGLDLLTDRNRYQPGELVRVWVRVRGERASIPHPNRRVRVTLTDASGTPLARAEASTGASGVVTPELELPETAAAGPYRVQAEVLDAGPSAARSVEVWERTVERLMAEIELRGGDDDGVTLVAPGGRLRGRVQARTPSGTAVRDATVQLRVRPGAEPTTLTTGDDGYAEFELRAPAFLSGEIGSETLSARVVHPAHGTAVTSASYLMARVRAVVGVTARGGAIVPEIRSTLYLSVSDPRGRPLPAGTGVRVRGEGLNGGSAEATVDDKGFADVTLELPRGAASRMTSGDCAGQIATTLEVEVLTDPPRTARVCARVAADAEVAPVLDGPPLASPGASLDVEVRRRPGARGRAVLLEALFEGRAVAAAWVDANASRGRLELPGDLLGMVTLRARAARPTDAREPATEPGAIGLGIGSFDAVLVRPADAFSLEVSPARSRYLVRETAEVSLRASRAPAGHGWAALLVRDEAAHGGEGPWDLYWMRGALHEAAQRPADEVNARLLRASLSGALSLDPEPAAPPPLEEPYWRQPRRRGSYQPGMQAGRGVLRDPIALREELLRRGLGPIQVALERAVRELGADASERAPIVDGQGASTRFDRDVLEHLVSAHRLSRSSAVTLGGEDITVAMVERADPGFSFDTVAGRVARERLSRLLLALLQLSDPDDPNAQRVSANLPPERWLGTLVQLGMVQARDLTDPWGNAFVYRRVSGRRPQVALSERTLDWELASAGPDGRLGTSDDVADPYARIVPEGTPYAVVSGEDTLMRRLAALAPASTVLSRMSRAYDRLALAAREEQRAGPVTASSSEVADEEMAEAEADDAMGPLGGVGSGYGRGAGGMGARSRARRRVPPGPPPAEPAPADGLVMEQRDRPRRAEAMGALIRQDFPATLFFAGQVPLSDAQATVEVPLADALTTYRLEAIAWSGSGWTTSASARLSVDQEALVDAPIPERATVGDRLRLPIRVENRTDATLPVQVLIESEGAIGFEPGEPVRAEIPAREARELVVGLTLAAAGEGALVVSVARQGGGPLDAVRRPIQVLADARAARDRREVLVDGLRTVAIEVPAEASERGPGQVRLWVGGDLFGDVSASGHPLWAAWSLTLAGEPLPEGLSEHVLSWVTYEDEERDRLREPQSSALALAAAWRDERLTDADAQRALRSVSQGLPPLDAGAVPPESIGDQPSWLLLALAPVAAHRDHRPALREDVARVLSRLTQLTSSHAAQATDAPQVWARAAAALALSGGSRDRAVEMVRRAGRHVIHLGDMSWLEPERPSGEEPRARPTALLALAQIALGRRQAALSLVRSLVEMHRASAVDDPVGVLRSLAAGGIAPRPPPPFEAADWALASAAAARLSPGPAPEEVTVRLDGQPVQPQREGGVWVAPLEGIGRPGSHRLELELPEGVVALASVGLTYAMPWDVPPRRQARIDLDVEGEIGARDTRAGVRLTVRNRGARILTRPVVEVELPAGAELDEPTRDALAEHLLGPAHQEGRTLLLPLRPLAPGGWVRLPLPLRWSVGGTLRGLGAVAYDASGASRAEVLPVAVLPSRAIEIPDQGPQPEAPEHEASEGPAPVPPLPPPIPLLERISQGRG